MRSDDRIILRPARCIGGRHSFLRVGSCPSRRWIGCEDAQPYAILVIEQDRIISYCMDREICLEDLLQTVPGPMVALERVEASLAGIAR